MHRLILQLQTSRLHHPPQSVTFHKLWLATDLNSVRQLCCILDALAVGVPSVFCFCSVHSSVGCVSGRSPQAHKPQHARQCHPRNHARDRSLQTPGRLKHMQRHRKERAKSIQQETILFASPEGPSTPCLSFLFQRAVHSLVLGAI